MRGLILLLAFLLSGCWEGDVFYAASESRSALPPGTYRVISPANKPGGVETTHVSILPNGLTRFGDEKDHDVVGFVPLNGPYYVMWFQDEEGGHQALYGLLQRERARFRILLPDCDRTKAIAAAAGAQIAPDPKVTTCRFGTRAQLEDGLRHLEGQGIDSIQLIPMAAARGGSRPAP